MSGDGDFWPRLVVAILATWRIAHLFAREDGPGDIVARARRAMGDGWWGRAFDCFHCLSLVVAAPVALWIDTTVPDVVLVWLAISGAACLCERLGAPEVVMHPLPDAKAGEDDGMLRPDT